MVRQRLELKTRHLVLRPIAEQDASRLHEVWSSAGVRRFLWDDEIIPLARTQAAVERNQRMFAEQGVGLWGAWKTGAPDLTGFGGLWPFREPPELELLYGVAEHVWGNGYATEIAQAVIDYCFDTLAMPVVRASSDVANLASVRVLEKLGFQFESRRIVGGLDTMLYQLPRPG